MKTAGLFSLLSLLLFTSFSVAWPWPGSYEDISGLILRRQNAQSSSMYPMERYGFPADRPCPQTPNHPPQAPHPMANLRTTRPRQALQPIAQPLQEVLVSPIPPQRMPRRPQKSILGCRLVV